MWVADRPIELYVISIYAGDIDITIQCYENITEISRSDMVYRLYYDNPPQVQSHTHIVHGKILMTQVSGTAESHTSEIYRSPPPSESPHGNDFHCKLNGKKKVYNKIAKEVVF